MSGAKSYEPFLHVERAELAQLTGDEPTRERELRKGIGCSSRSAPRSAPSRSRRSSPDEVQAAVPEDRRVERIGVAVLDYQGPFEMSRPAATSHP
jgi:hypothetical protein